MKSAETPDNPGEPPGRDAAVEQADAEPATATCSEASCDDDNPCTDDLCENGVCQHEPHGDACTDDGNSCTRDVCNDGLCTHPSNGTCLCKNAEECDDQDPCTTDSCSAAKTCTNAPIAGCPDDPDPEKCTGPEGCDDQNVCTDDACGADGKCTHAPNKASCTKDTNDCTDDVCSEGVCTAVPNKAPCADDGSTCTDDVCSGGTCEHEPNGSCECVKDEDCVDPNACTDDKCGTDNKCQHTFNTAPCATDNDTCTCDVCSQGTCSHPPAEMCPAPASVVINNFNSSEDWDMNRTTPGGLAITGKDTFGGWNLENNERLYLAEISTATLVMDVPNLAGLESISIEIQSNQSGTASMVELGVFDSSKNQWFDRALSNYGTIGQGSYTTLTVPLKDFAVTPCSIGKVRLDISATGGEKIWRVQGIVAQ